MSNAGDLICWRCAATLDEHPLPLSFRAECEACGADLHVCQLCMFYDTSAADQCREPVAERVTNKERNNYCDYFKPKAIAPGSASPGTGQSEGALDALFGLDSASPAGTGVDDNMKALEDLFGDKPSQK